MGLRLRRNSRGVDRSDVNRAGLSLEADGEYFVGEVYLASVVYIDGKVYHGGGHYGTLVTDRSIRFVDPNMKHQITWSLN